MPIDQSLWVQDRYAVRCQACERPFTIFRRRHHCRQCGQIFCSGCLYKPSSTANGSTQPSAPDADAILAQKICDHCAVLLLSIPLSAPGGAPSAEVLPRNAAPISSEQRSEIRHNEARQPCSSEAQGKQETPAAPAPASVSLILTESKAERTISYAVEDVARHRRVAALKRDGVRAWLATLRQQTATAPSPSLDAPGNEDDSFGPPSLEDMGDPNSLRRQQHIFEEKSFSPSAWKGVALADYIQYMRELCVANQGADTLRPYMDGIIAATWYALYSTRQVWGSSSILQHVDVLSVAIPSSTGATAGLSSPSITTIDGIVVPRRLTSNRAPAHWPHNPRLLLLAGDVGINESRGQRRGADSGGCLSEYVSSYQGLLDKLFQRIKVWSPQVIAVEGAMHHYLQSRIADDGRMSLLLHVGRADLAKLAGACHASIVRDLQYVGLAELQQPSRSPLGACRSFHSMCSYLKSDAGGSSTVSDWCCFEGVPHPWHNTILLCVPRGLKLSPTVVSTVLTTIKESLLVGSHLLAVVQIAAALHWRPAASAQEATKGADARVVPLTPIRCVNDLVAGFYSAGASGAKAPEPRVFTPYTMGSLRAQRVHYELVGTEAPRRAAAAAVAEAPVATQIEVPALDTPAAAAATATSNTVSPTQAFHHFQVDEFAFYRGGEATTLLDFLLGQCVAGATPRFFWAHSSRKITVSAVSSPILATTAADDCWNGAAAEAETTELLSATLRYRHRGGAEATPSSAVGGGLPFAIRAIHIRSDCAHCDDRNGGCWVGVPAAALSVSLGGFLAFLFRHNVALRHALCGATLDQGYSFAFRVALDGIEESAKGPRRPPSVTAITLEVSSIPIFRLRAPATVRAATATRDTIAGESSTVPNAIVDELELDAVAVHSAVLQCIADADTEGVIEEEENGATRGWASDSVQSPVQSGTKTPPSSVFDGSAGAESKSSGAPAGSGVRELVSLRARAADLVAQARPSATSLEAASAFRWRQLRPLLADVRHWASAHQQVLTAEPAWSREWLYSSEDGVAVRREDPASYVAAALVLHARKRHGVSKDGNISESDRGKAAVGDTSLLEACGGDDGGRKQVTSAGWRGAAAQRLHQISASTLDTEKVCRYVLRNLCAVAAAGAGDPPAQLVVDVFFPDAFAALYGMASGAAAADALLCSLHHSEVHQPQGGKTNSLFRITHDGRYLLKQIKSQELRHFPTWATSYFAHMASCCSKANAEHPSFLACTVGLFGVQAFALRRAPPTASLSSTAASGASLPHPQSSAIDSTSAPLNNSFDRPPALAREPTSLSPAPALAPPQPPASPLRRGESSPWIGGEVQYFAIMENTAKRLPASPTSTTMSASVPVIPQPALGFDLKGSQRNRTAPAGSSVKLDADLITEYLHHGRFFFCTPDDKGSFMRTLSRDVEMLRAAGVMDYSLFVAVQDDASGAGSSTTVDLPVLHLSVIDYLHPFTGAKLLESRMKSGLDTVLGHAGRDPTIIDPAAYRDRFVRWMGRYFCAVPEHETWNTSGSHRLALLV